MFVDTHAHIYSEEFNVDLGEIIKSAKDAGVTDIFMPNIDSKSVQPMMTIAEKYSFCHPMIGLHPCHVFDDYKTELKTIEKHLSGRNFAGVGEIGIDLYWDKSFAAEQEDAFRFQISMAKNALLPFVIHSRDSLDITIQIVEEMQDGSLSGIFHCFGGTIEQAKKIINLGFYLGIGGILTYKNSGVDKVIEEIPLSALVLETDAPYLSPVPHRGKRNEPLYLLKVAEKLSEIKDASISDIATQTTANAKKIFKHTPIL